VLVIVVGYAAISATLIALGRLLAGPLDGSGLVHWDERQVQHLADRRTPLQDTITLVWSRLADAPGIIAVAVLVAIVLAIGRHWAAIGVLLGSIALEFVTFLTVSYSVGRQRPSVPHLGSLPSTSSFPSGHVAATLVLYGILAYLANELIGRRWASHLIVVWTVVAACGVGWSRVYRGMHHPLDVLAGSLMGIALLAVILTALRPTRQESARTPHGDDRREARA